MPHTPGIEILRAWRHTGEEGRIHYMIRTHDGVDRHLYVDDGTGLGRVLNEALLAQGYSGPPAADEH